VAKTAVVADSLIDRLPVGAGIGPPLPIPPLSALLASPLIIVDKAVSPNHAVLLKNVVGAGEIGPPPPVAENLSPLVAPELAMISTGVPTTEVTLEVSRALIGPPPPV
jgi:hypothetical protein